MNLMLLVIIVLFMCLGCFFYLIHRLRKVSDNGDLAASVDLEVDKFTQKIPLSAMVVGVYQNNQTYIKGYGTAEPDESTIFQIASLSKLFTTSLLAILCEEKIVRMSSTLEELIGHQYELSTDAKLVTLEQLATHKSGFPKVPKSLLNIAIQVMGKDKLMNNPYSTITLSHVWDYLKTTDDKKLPGRFEYSNFGIGLLGHVLEMVMEKDLDQLTKERIFMPLNMGSTSIKLTPQMTKNLTQGYSSDGTEAELWTFGALAGAGAFHSNIDDLMKFVVANIDASNPIAATLMSTEPLAEGQPDYVGWMKPQFIERFFGNKTSLWHNGMVGGYSSYIAFDTVNKTGVAILSSKAVDVTMLGIMLMRQARTQSWHLNTRFKPI